MPDAPKNLKKSVVALNKPRDGTGKFVKGGLGDTASSSKGLKEHALELAITFRGLAGCLSEAEDDLRALGNISVDSLLGSIQTYSKIGLPLAEKVQMLAQQMEPVPEISPLDAESWMEAERARVLSLNMSRRRAATRRRTGDVRPPQPPPPSGFASGSAAGRTQKARMDTSLDMLIDDDNSSDGDYQDIPSRRR